MLMAHSLSRVPARGMIAASIGEPPPLGHTQQAIWPLTAGPARPSDHRMAMTKPAPRFEPRPDARPDSRGVVRTEAVPRPQHFAFVLLDNFTLMAFAGAIEPLRLA